MNENQYENFKQGIKNDINNTASSLFLVGGLILLVIVMLTTLFMALKDDRIDSSIRIAMGVGVAILGGVMIFNKKALNLILGGWLILIVAAVVLPIFFLIGYMLYNLFKQPLQ